MKLEPWVDVQGAPMKSASGGAYAVPATVTSVREEELIQSSNFPY